MFCKKSIIRRFLKLKRELVKVRKDFCYKNRDFNIEWQQNLTLQNKLSELERDNFNLAEDIFLLKENVEQLKHENQQLQHKLCVAVEENNKPYNENFNLSEDKMFLEDKAKKENVKSVICRLCIGEGFVNDVNEAAGIRECPYCKGGGKRLVGETVAKVKTCAKPSQCSHLGGCKKCGRTMPEWQLRSSGLCWICWTPGYVAT